MKFIVKKYFFIMCIIYRIVAFQFIMNMEFKYCMS